MDVQYLINNNDSVNELHGLTAKKVTAMVSEISVIHKKF